MTRRSALSLLALGALTACSGIALISIPLALIAGGSAIAFVALLVEYKR